MCFCKRCGWGLTWGWCPLWTYLWLVWFWWWFFGIFPPLCPWCLTPTLVVPPWCWKKLLKTSARLDAVKRDAAANPRKKLSKAERRRVLTELKAIKQDVLRTDSASAETLQQARQFEVLVAPAELLVCPILCPDPARSHRLPHAHAPLPPLIPHVGGARR